jgi:hypothetical protein
VKIVFYEFLHFNIEIPLYVAANSYTAAMFSEIVSVSRKILSSGILLKTDSNWIQKQIFPKGDIKSIAY